MNEKLARSGWKQPCYTVTCLQIVYHWCECPTTGSLILSSPLPPPAFCLLPACCRNCVIQARTETSLKFSCSLFWNSLLLFHFIIISHNITQISCVSYIRYGPFRVYFYIRWGYCWAYDSAIYMFCCLFIICKKLFFVTISYFDPSLALFVHFLLPYRFMGKLHFERR